MSVRLAWHWAATAGSAAAFAGVAGAPFTGSGAQAVCLIVAAAVGFIGYAIAPNIRKDTRP
ncbi:hypothetical protein ACKI14_02290 [Streptomyces turgidiscabies]|uniref:hypothetical protein n=1 Tax=Streptomyces turgidiscabies TaxID=85558 RepID=UPI0038F6985F